MAQVSIVTTCKGRLEHLQASLPRLVALPDSEVVMVDYDCPEGAGDWARAACPKARVVSVRDRPIFNLAKARNLGSAATSAPWIFFIDADVLAEPDLAAIVWPLLRARTYLRPDTRAQDLCGSVIVARADFIAVGGYDEVFEGWGSEDVDFYARLGLTGVTARGFPARAISTIAHDNRLRSLFHAQPDMDANSAINALYAQAKIDLMRLGVPMDRAMREALYAECRTAAASPGGLLTVTCGEGNASHRTLTRQLRYELGPTALRA